jgi:hypothetical protein
MDPDTQHDQKSTAVSKELKEIFEADQAERVVGYENIDFETMRQNDVTRLARAREILSTYRNGTIVLDGEDLYRLGLLFQHSPNTDDYLVAVELGKKSGDLGNRDGAWLSAAAEDRHLTSRGLPQKWGTQFRKNGAGEWEQFPMQSDEESKITDEDREKRGVPSRAKQMEVFLQRDDI